MTVLKRVTQAEMKKRTGFGKALGYSFPEEDEILIRKDLPKDLEHEVIAHEEEHMSKGEEGPGFLDRILKSIPIIGPIAGALIGGSKQSSAAKSAAATAAQGSEREIEFARESRDLARADQAPYREAGYTALDALMSLTGLGGGAGAPKAPTAVTRDTRFPGGRPNIMERPSRRYRSQYEQRATGGPTGPGQMYNINELGPENAYSGGALTRNPNPMTIDGQTGYVEPNIQGRAYGGLMGFGPNYLGGDIAGNVIGGSYQDYQRNRRSKERYPDPQNPDNNIKLAPGANTAGTTAINPQTGYPNENPGGVEGGYNFMTEPGYQFRFSEGMRALDRGAAARGGLLSGGYGRKAIRYGQGFASNEFSNVYNRISNIAGLGQTAGTVSGQAALQGGYQMGTAASQGAYAQAAGRQASGNAWANAGNQIAQLPWGNVDWGSIFRPGQTQPIGGNNPGGVFRGNN